MSIADVHIPAMVGHTMTLVEDTKVWIIGGFSSMDYFSEHVYEYDTSNNQWTRLRLSGATPTGKVPLYFETKAVDQFGILTDSSTLVFIHCRTTI